DESAAVTEPLTGPKTNQPLWPVGVGSAIVIAGAVVSTLNLPVLIPALQLPAASQTWPDGMRIDAPSLVLFLVKPHELPGAAVHGEATPDITSEAVNAAVCVPRHHPVVL